MQRILIVDDHDIVRDGVKKIFDQMPDKLSLGEASNAGEALRLIREQDWDMMVLDISMEGRSGLDILKEAKQLRPKLAVLVFSMHAEEQYALRAFKAGASGYITKVSPRQELAEAINRVLKGGRYVNPALAEKLIFDFSRESAKDPHEILSDREYQVMCLLASGKTVTEIAGCLALSDKTISTYRARVLEKMRLKTNAELTYYAMQNRLIE
jgi:two-component system, NarL family, invasion response regulator UvrY